MGLGGMFELNKKHHINDTNPVNGLKDDGGSTSARSEGLQARRGLTQIHGTYQNPEKHLGKQEHRESRVNPLIAAIPPGLGLTM